MSLPAPTLKGQPTTWDDRIPLGALDIYGRTYTAYALPIGPLSASSGVVAHYAFEGPRGALWLVIDYGPRYRVTSLNMSSGAARPVPGFGREHLDMLAGRV